MWMAASQKMQAIPEGSLMGWLSNPDVRSAISSLHRKLSLDKR
jgi:hypothetical protein